MRFMQWFQPPHHLLTLFLAITLALATGLGWLGWRILQQDRALEGQRVQERLGQAADLVSASLSRKIAGLEERIRGISALPEPAVTREASHYAQELGSDAMLVVFRPEGIDAYPRSRLLFYSSLPNPKQPAQRIFGVGESFEFREKDYPKAIASYRELARSPDVLIRAGALLRLGRVLRKMHQPDKALVVYEELGKLDPSPVGGLPAGLLARAASCELLFETNRNAELEREAAALYLDLNGGRWKLARATYRFYAQEVSGWVSPSERHVADQRIDAAPALTAGVDSLWEEWQRIRQGEGAPSGRRSLWVYEQSVFLVWHSTPGRLVGLVARPGYFKEQWQGPMQPFERQGMRVTLTDAEGHPILGQNLSVSSHQVTRAASDTQLPWTLRVASASPGAVLAESASRRRLLLAGLGMMALVVLVGSYFVGRAVTRELEVARLQSDFVSAVSHEFRTPLASLLQLSELLADGRVSTDSQRQMYYRSLFGETQRLSRLVEGLLDFGRMEAGGCEYRFELLEPGGLIRSVAEEFGREVEQRGYEVEIKLDGELPPVRGDREALGRALWNLLDNAVKYSPQCKTVWVEAACNNGPVAIRVRDHGLGIAPGEQEEIFKKFVRASSAWQAGVKGTGLGLAMVKRIAAAHGGRAFVESEPGAGSTFTISLPAAKE
jgi:signal transduction histidine kinase/tetratricopeptide (TPR) repeat protein